MKPIFLVCFLLRLLIPTSHATSDQDDSTASGTSILFFTLGRLDYAFDIFSLPTRISPPISISHEIKITDGKSVNFNGHFPSPSSSSFLSLLRNQTLFQTVDNRPDPPPLKLVYVSERNGVSNIYYDEVYYDDSRSTRSINKRSTFEISDRVQVPLLDLEERKNRISMKDRPSLAGDYLVYVSTHEDFGVARTSTAAVYSTELKSGVTRRLTPYGVADFSPSASPSGKWTAVASYGARGWDGEIEELTTNIYVFLTRDGTRRVKVIEHGGWPCWGDETTLYFHRRGEDAWWSIYRAILPKNGQISTESVVIERVTPPGLHVFTPATSLGNKNFIAVATRRPTSKFRHIELFDLEKNEFTELTRLVSPETHHFNPFISSDSTRVGYHRCRLGGNGKESSRSSKLLLQNLPSPDPDISLFRLDGAFPAVSPAGDRIAYAGFPGAYVINPDGRNRRQLYDGFTFSTAWDPVRKGIIYTSAGPKFASAGTEVDIISINADDVDQSRIKKLTTNGKNNAFPSPSPDGKWIVFRSGRSGYKNLYIMDAEDGEKGGLHRLTNGPWSDTMCNWSPDGEWIAFASDRDSPDSGSFELYLIHPNGTGLRKVIQSGLGGRTNHPWFSPDGKSIVFTSDYGGISAEPIAYPHQYQPYGDIFTVKLDGSDVKRLTHNPYEDGTPTWVPKHIKAVDVEWLEDRPRCDFEDLHWLNDTPSHVGARTNLNVPNLTQCGGPGGSF
jgi:Tol biopolymer transport system component